MKNRTESKGYLPIELVQVALCPLSFTPTRLSEHILYKHPQQNLRLLKKDGALESLLVGDELDCWKHYKYWDHNENRKVGHVNIKAPFGMAPEDFDVIVGLYNYCRAQHREGESSFDPTVQFSLADIARICDLPHGGGKQALYLRSRLFRLGFVSLHFTAVWDTEERAHVQRTYKLFTIKSLSRLNLPKQKIVIQLDPSFVDLIASRRVIQFDRTLYNSMTAKHKRHYLQCVRFGWYSRTSPPDVLAADYACNQIWFADHDERMRQSGGVVSADDDRTHQRIGWLADLLKEAEAKYEIIKPTSKSGWKGEYFKQVVAGSGQVEKYIRWANGPRIKNKRQRNSKFDLNSDPLWQSICQFQDDTGHPITPATYRDWLDQYGADRVQQHVRIIEWMVGNRIPFTKSALQALADRVHKNHPAPDGYRQQTQTSLLDSSMLNRDPRVASAYDDTIKSI